MYTYDKNIYEKKKEKNKYILLYVFINYKNNKNKIDNKKFKNYQ